MENTTPNFETPLQRANRLKSIGQEIEPRIDKVWSYADSKDLSMNLGGLMQHSATPIALKLEKINSEMTLNQIAKIVSELTYELYVEKEKIIKNIKQQ